MLILIVFFLLFSCNWLLWKLFVIFPIDVLGFLGQVGWFVLIGFVCVLFSWLVGED